MFFSDMTKNGIVILTWVNKIISECTQATGKTDVMVTHYNYMHIMNSLYFILAVQFR